MFCQPASSDAHLREIPVVEQCILARLEAELDQLRGAPPKYVQSLSQLQEVRFPAHEERPPSHSEEDDLHQWDLFLVIMGNPECEAYDCACRFRLRFPRAWPSRPPVIRVLSTLHHWLVDYDKSMRHPFYAALEHQTHGARQHYTLQGVVAALHQILVHPRSVLNGAAKVCLPSVVLPFELGASRYRGTVEHLAAGKGAQELVVSLHKRKEEAVFEGRWDAFGRNGLSLVILDLPSHEVMMYLETPLGEVILDGTADPTSGVLCGSCELNRTFGTFELKPSDFADEAHAKESANHKRLAIINEYARIAKNPSLFALDFHWREDWLVQAFSRVRTSGTHESWRGILTEHIPGRIFSFPLFSPSFCDMLVEELLNFHDSGLPARRPNSMNGYGVILSEIGLETFADCLQELLQPLGEILWPGPGTDWDDHHCFTVRYREGEDLGLDMHHDDSDVTFNVCLGIEFEGAGLQFCGLVGDPEHRKHRFTYRHVKGSCVAHLGRHRHGADDIISGDRINLILWNRSSEYRKSLTSRPPDEQAEKEPPDIQCLSFTHDRDFEVFRTYPPGKEHLRSSAWCPSENCEYHGFRREAQHGYG